MYYEKKTKNSQPKVRTGYDNLHDQILSLKNSINAKGIATRARYFEGTDRFVRYCAEEWHLQKFVNVSGKHIRAYVEYMRDKELTPNTIVTELSSIRFFYGYSGGKNRLPDNKELPIGKRNRGELNRAWFPEEVEKAYSVAIEMGRIDAAFGIRLGERFGLRIHEMCELKVEQLLKAVRYGELTVKGKGTQIRAIPIENEKQREIVYRLINYARSKGMNPGDCVIVQKDKRGIEKEIAALSSWMYNNRRKFTDPDRQSKVNPGEKERIELPSWHGFRHYYAQTRYNVLKNVDGKNALKEVSERLGHHRPGITKVYLAEKTLN